MKTISKTREATSIIKRAYNVKSLRVPLEEGESFRPGQFILLSLDVNGGELKRYLSISNSPTEEGYLECTKKLTGSDFSSAFDSLKPGDSVNIKFPYGNFTFDGEHGKIAFLAGGIGITPVRSILKYAVDKKTDTDAVLIYSINSYRDAVFMDDLRDLQKQSNRIKIFNKVFSGWDEKKNDPSCSPGNIDCATIKEIIPDFSERVFFLCGPPSMVKCMEDILTGGLNVRKEAVKKENFTGY